MLCTVKMYDGYNDSWEILKENISPQEAKNIFNIKTKNSTEHILKYELDYCQIIDFETGVPLTLEQIKNI